MRDEIKERLEAVARELKRASDALKLDAGLDAQFASRLLSGAINHMDMQLERQYGRYLCLKEPVPPAEVQEPRPNAKAKAKESK